MSDLKADIAAVLDALCACWNATDLGPIRDLWDADEAVPFALPQEILEPIISWERYERYLREGEARLHGSSMRWWDLNVKELAPGLAVALYQMHWNGQIKGFSFPMGVDSRVTAIFRRKPEGWKICHYVEAMPSPLLHLQQAYAAAVDPEFKVEAAGR